MSHEILQSFRIHPSICHLSTKGVTKSVRGKNFWQRNVGYLRILFDNASKKFVIASSNFRISTFINEDKCPVSINFLYNRLSTIFIALWNACKTCSVIGISRMLHFVFGTSILYPIFAVFKS